MIKIYLWPLADVIGNLPARSDPIMFLSSLVAIALKATLCVLDLVPEVVFCSVGGTCVVVVDLMPCRMS